MQVGVTNLDILEFMILLVLIPGSQGAEVE
jgi:hypothetical protein